MFYACPEYWGFLSWVKFKSMFLFFINKTEDVGRRFYFTVRQIGSHQNKYLNYRSADLFCVETKNFVDSFIILNIEKKVGLQSKFRRCHHGSVYKVSKLVLYKEKLIPGEIITNWPLSHLHPSSRIQ